MVPPAESECPLADLPAAGTGKPAKADLQNTVGNREPPTGAAVDAVAHDRILAPGYQRVIGGHAYEAAVGALEKYDQYPRMGTQWIGARAVLGDAIMRSTVVQHP